jgi:RNA polymerase sigma-54 factor
MQQNQVLETKQKLAFTQDLRQSLAILQMPFAELETHISQQIFDNCLLEQEDISNDNPDNPEENTDTETFSLDDLVSQEVVRNDQNTESEYFEADLIADSMQHPTNITITGQNIYEHLQTLAPSLHEHLIAQFNLTARTDKKSMLAEFLIGSIDEDGYLRCKISDAANICAVSVAETEGMVKLIQTFEPFGVGARNLRECLLIQLELLQEYLTEVKGFQRQFLDLTKIIIENHLQDIAEAKLQKIAHHLKCPVVDIQSAVDLIKTLDPKPGRNFGDQKDIGYILPDVKIRNPEHDYLIMINEPANAKLFISPLYRNLIQNREYVGSDVIKHLRTKQNAALNLMRSIDERKKPSIKSPA